MPRFRVRSQLALLAPQNDTYSTQQDYFMTDLVLQSLDNGLLTITMNRPDRRNALNVELTQGLVAVRDRKSVV